MTDFTKIKAGMAGVYERNADAWDAGRDTSLREKAWLDQTLDGLTTPAKVLDLGCGTGRPIAAYFASLGHDVTGVDASSAMIHLAQSHVETATWHVMDMRALTLADTFDVIVSWDAFFHLSPQEQRATLPKIIDLVNPGGSLLLTVGYGEGEVTGTVAGQPVYHGSLSQDEYRAILDRGGFTDITYIPNDPTVLGRYVMLARSKQSA
ncbi:class I SAM-dependent methyltransferase [Shimia sp.]|uniref:class I SAM-dependent methyltransferase n=1 Tax=Shimia sp. TaxID=1954381 RepID=UPI003B8D825E